MSKPSHKPKTGKPIRHKPAEYDDVLSGVVELLDAARRASARVVNSLMTATYWEVGRRIVEHEQAGEKRAEYGEELVRKFALDLTERFGRGFGFSQVKMMRQFYQTFPDAHAAKPLILQTTVEKSGISQSLIGQSGNPESSLAPIGQSVIGQFSERSSVKLTRALERLGQIARAFPLPWTHYVRLLRVRNSHARDFCLPSLDGRSGCESATNDFAWTYCFFIGGFAVWSSLISSLEIGRASCRERV